MTPAQKEFGIIGEAKMSGKAGVDAMYELLCTLSDAPMALSEIAVDLYGAGANQTAVRELIKKAKARGFPIEMHNSSGMDTEVYGDLSPGAYVWLIGGSKMVRKACDRYWNRVHKEE